MYDYPLLVIGAGPGGYTAALRAAALGVRGAVIEAHEAGGTCVNRGCVPTKTLLHASSLYREAAAGAAYGIHAEELRADLPEIFAHRFRVSETLSQGVENMLRAAKVPLIRGRAQITAPHCVRVTAPDGSTQDYTAGAILIAVGARPQRLPIPGMELPGVLTSDELLQGQQRLFQSVVIIGGGVIGIEFALFYSELGCPVTILEGLDRLLPGLDRELGQNLALLLKKQGVQIHTGAMVQAIERSGDALRVRFAAKGGEAAAQGEAVICAVGRRPALDGLFAEGLQPELDGAVLRTDAAFQTSIPGVYAIGDAASPIQFAHLAAAQGTVFAEKLCGVKPGLDLSLIPTVIHTRPEIASVGLTEAEAKAAGIAVKTGKCVLGGNAMTLIREPGRSFMKLVARADTGALIGAQLMCLGAADMISQLSQAIANGMRPEQLLRAMRPHPTCEESLSDALKDLSQKLQ